MSYNGIGLSSAKGSSTSGYVQANLSSRGIRRYGHYESRKHYEEIQEYNERKAKASSAGGRSIDPDILKHEMERKIEIQCLTYQEELEDQGLDEDAIEEKVAAYREKLRARKNAGGSSRLDNSGDSKNRHEQTVAKRSQNEQFERAIKGSRLHKGRHDNRHTWKRQDRGEDSQRRSQSRSRSRSRSPDAYRDSQDRSNDPSRHAYRSESGRDHRDHRASRRDQTYSRDSRSQPDNPAESGSSTRPARSPSPYSKRKQLRPYED